MPTYETLPRFTAESGAVHPGARDWRTSPGGATWRGGGHRGAHQSDGVHSGGAHQVDSTQWSLPGARGQEVLDAIKKDLAAAAGI
ncbi:hypothetical protein ACF05T_33955 [Streptomyces lateritius]|uniref:Uncharacterized protein n=1 Tax=Streptomyces lateritius TaxID=67313 RepID=A0ABW6YMA9_9ACTN